MICGDRKAVARRRAALPRFDADCPPRAPRAKSPRAGAPAAATTVTARRDARRRAAQDRV